MDSCTLWLDGGVLLNRQFCTTPRKCNYQRQTVHQNIATRWQKAHTESSHTFLRGKLSVSSLRGVLSFPWRHRQEGNKGVKSPVKACTAPLEKLHWVPVQPNDPCPPVSSRVPNQATNKTKLQMECPQWAWENFENRAQRSSEARL